MTSRFLSIASGILALASLFSLGVNAQPADRIRETWKGPDLALIRSILKGGGGSKPSTGTVRARAEVVKFTPAGDSGVAETLAAAFGRTDDEKSALTEAFRQIKQGYEAEVAKEGKSNNLAAAMTFFIATNVAAYHRADMPSDEAGEALFKSLVATMSGSPEFARLSNAEKQQMHDWLVCMAGFVMTGYTDAKQNNDQEGLKNFAELADYSMRLVLGVEVGKMNVSPEGLSLGEGSGGSNQMMPAGAHATGISMATTKFEDGWVAQIDSDYVHLAKDGMDIYANQ